MKKLLDLAQVLRSKNAGPLTLTIDLMFASQADYQQVKNSGVLTAQSVAAAYQVPPETVRIIAYDLVRALKITLPRQQVSGASADLDIYGCQQHMPLAQFLIPEAKKHD